MLPFIILFHDALTKPHRHDPKRQYCEAFKETESRISAKWIQIGALHV